MNVKIKPDWKDTLEKYLPQKIYSALSCIDIHLASSIEEIRMRTSKPLMVYTGEKGFCVNAQGGLGGEGLFIGNADIEQIFNAITGKSPYAFEDDLRQGFLTLSSGIRAGIAGSAVLSDGHIRTYKNINGINFRIPKEAFGISKQLLPYISKKKRLINTLIVSSPKLGKTTLIRDIARCAGSGIGIGSCKISLIDERQELAAIAYGEPLFDVGTETDVISGVQKHVGVFMALRALSPEVIITDEIGKSADLEALREVANAGVTMITTAHAPDLNTLLNRLFFKQVFEERLFDAYVVLSASLGRITVAQIHDGLGQELLKAPFLLQKEDI
jgi:stage III sporulation protein AA